MKKFMGVAVLILFVARFGQARGLSLKLTGGAAYITGGDYNYGVDGMNAYLAALGDNVSGAFSKLRFGMNFGAELVLNLNEHIGLGLGAGYMRFSRDRQDVGYDWDFYMITFHDTDFLKPSVTAISITLNFHYKFPAGRVKLDLFAGVSYIIAKMKTESGFDSDFLGISSDIIFESHTVGGKFGLQGGLGIEIPLGGSFSFVADVTGRYVSLKDIQGNYTKTGTQLGIPYTVSGTDAFFYSGVLRCSGKSYEILDWITDANAPSGAGYSDVRHATFDLTGVSAQAGIKIGF